MMAKVEGLKKEVESLKGNGGGNGGGSGGGGNNGNKRDKSQLKCHACNQKGHFKYEKVCPKYDETMAKKNESGGGSNTGGNKSGKDSWKFTKTTDVIEKNGQKYYWCPKCNKGKGMYVISHGAGHPTKPAHDDNFKANRQQPAEQQNLAIESAGDGPTVSFGGVDFDMPIGFLGVIDDDAEAEWIYPKVRGR